MKKLLALLALPLLAAPVAAATITATAVDGNLYQQTVQSPCVFTNPSCDQGSWVGTAVPNQGNETDWDLLSPLYTGAQIFSIIGSTALRLGLDINQASGKGPQTLAGFYMAINGTWVDAMAAALSVPAGNNGNGYADYLLSGFSSFSPTDTVQFRFVFSNANDGAENVFLIGGPCRPGDTNCQGENLPEPATLALLGTALAGLGLLRRRRRQ